MSNKQGRTRREILADTAKAAAGAAVAGLAGCFPDVGGKWPAAAPDAPPQPDGGGQCSDGDPTKFGPVTPAVVEVFREDSIVAGTKTTYDPAVVAQMLEAGLAALANEVKTFEAGGAAGVDGGAVAQDLDNPWPTLLPSYQQGQRIGLKVNCLGVVTPSPPLMRALIASLRDKLPIAPGNLRVWDRFLVDIKDHGKWTDEDLGGAANYGTLLRGPSEGETEDDPQLTAGCGYGDTVCSAPLGWDQVKAQPGMRPRLTRMLTHETDLNINCLALKSHNISGITGAIKSVYGIVHNPAEYHKDFNEVAAQLYAIPAVRKALPLAICDGIVALTMGDPARPANAVAKRILLAQDPVALDSYIVDLLNELNSGKTRPIDTALLSWLDRAAELGLGTRSYKLVKV